MPRQRRTAYRLSASTLSVLLDCPRCFWLQVHEEVRRPQGPFPSLPGGMDAILKVAMDEHRRKGARPPELPAHVSGSLFPDQRQLDRWRDALRGELRWTDETLGVEVVGGIDDLLVEKDGSFTPLDFKTRGWAIKEDSHAHYEHQLDLYAWLFERLGHRTSGSGVLLFFSPEKYEGDGRVKFRIEPVIMKTSVKRAQNLLERGASVLRGSKPEQHADCNFCHYAMTLAVPDI